MNDKEFKEKEIRFKLVWGTYIAIMVIIFTRLMYVSGITPDGIRYIAVLTWTGLIIIIALPLVTILCTYLAIPKPELTSILRPLLDVKGNLKFLLKDVVDEDAQRVIVETQITKFVGGLIDTWLDKFNAKTTKTIEKNLTPTPPDDKSS